MATLILVGGTIFAAATDRLKIVENQYIGADACKNCHSSEFKIWSVSKHSRTYVQLGTATVESIDPDAEGFVPVALGGPIVAEARKQGIDTDCLRCHTTAENMGNDRKAETFHPEDGVQCEACHGPGGDHVTWMEDQTEPRPSDSRMRAFTLKDCAEACHRHKPTHEAAMILDFSAPKAWKKIAHGQTAE